MAIPLSLVSVIILDPVESDLYVLLVCLCFIIFYLLSIIIAYHFYNSSIEQTPCTHDACDSECVTILSLFQLILLISTKVVC